MISPLTVASGIDILRITLATTLYSLTPWRSLKRENNHLQRSPPDFNLFTAIAVAFGGLHTPASHPTSRCIDSQIRRGCPYVKLYRGLVDQDTSLEDATAYEKIIEVYSPHVLARLGAGEGSRGFMRYEEELPEEVKQV